MRVLVEYLLICIVPAAVISLAFKIPWLLRRLRKGAMALHPTHRPIERLADDLHRLGSELQLVRAGGGPARKRRLNAIELAYEDILLECCAALELPHPARPPLSREERLHVEASLLKAGLRW
ncbi:hypothetical protein [Allobranchiibius sp. CTAmp26]|uniref:hypothetical protein n=1 Tax=Allobranchiibius sp. CTAmp26 TaxID=2815214 RepID=UPI001AA1C5A7|nr:hypothetical protein [Allobranchiibius sp. CTAmp26]MBO1756373.1 hypothetical protein [Allobranchiibius sp. CTAmp26]